MAARQRGRPQTSAPGDGSRTIVIHDSQPREEGSNPDRGGESSTGGTLRLRGAHRSTQRVVWREDVVDNEGAGKKKSKICCIYNKPRQFDESSSDESDSDSDSDCGGHSGHNHAHPHHDGPNGHGTVSRDGGGGGDTVHQLESDSDDVNVYERAPKKGKKGKNPAPRDT